ncbi:site-specific integrase [Breoghania sp.]|uniref:site-specific integrase n=1 Tax=Breoghania sp. TaxID=2065378 RepID=UPI002AA6F049|nr:site-specific integrase [Breoghania sp.]
MGLVLKYARLTKAGTWQYRRRIPTKIREFLKQGEFKRFLGSTEREALANFPKIDAEFERLVAVANRRASGASTSSQTPLEQHREAERIAKEMAQGAVVVGGRTLPASDPEAADILRDSYLSRFPTDPETGEPLADLDAEGRAINILHSGGNVERPAPTLADAKRLYISEKITGDINEVTKRARLERVVGYMAHAVDESRPLSSLTREDAREVRDHMIRDLEMRPSTVRRYLNDVRALINHGLTEFGLRDAQNPFLNLHIRSQGVARAERSPIPAQTLKAIRARLSAHAGADLWRIWRIVEGTGCRLGEITGLLVSDLHLEEPCPYIDVIPHPHRRLKTAGSERRVPLIGEALEAAQEATDEAGEGRFLFASYGRVRGADGASAALMRHVRVITDDPKIVVHSLRHNMEDLLARARVSEFDRNLVLGHARGSMSERYGGQDARLEAAERALRAALGLSADKSGGKDAQDSR